ncbi:MAG TPA: DUF484 family protein [Burkholderiales bacterium]|nr:DUF484 family protein [Burkholderiales bacterium]
MISEDVARYLQEHPEFFEEQAELMSSIYVPHPHGGRAIPIAERQIVALREKNRTLEEKLRQLIRFGEDNDAIGEKVHRLALALLPGGDLRDTLHALVFNLREDFAVPHVALRLWGMAGDEAGLPEVAPVSDGVRILAEGLTQPYCGGHAADEVAGWFGEDRSRLRSFALVALRRERPLGLLVLASEDPQRFYPEMGTLYLARIGEMASAALTRFAH